MDFKIIDENGNMVLSGTSESKTIRGLRSELKRTSFAIQDNWKIILEYPVN